MPTCFIVAMCLYGQTTVHGLTRIIKEMRASCSPNSDSVFRSIQLYGASGSLFQEKPLPVIKSFVSIPI